MSYHFEQAIVIPGST